MQKNCCHPPADGAHIGFELRRVSNLIRRRIDGAMSSHGVERLTGMQGRVIGYLCFNAHRDVFQRDIENEFSVRRSTATAMLQTMERHGLIERVPVESDGRLKKLIPTPLAAERHKLFISEVDRVEAEVLSGITPEEADTLLQILDRIRKNLGE